MMLIILDKLLLILYGNKNHYNNPKVKDEWRVEEKKEEKVEKEEKVKKVENVKEVKKVENNL